MAFKGVGAAMADAHPASHQCHIAELAMITTPLFALFCRFLSDRFAYGALALTYAALIVLITALFFPPDVFNMVYVDMGRQ